MVAISTDCPWCNAKNASLEQKCERRSDKGKAHWEWLVRCSVCMAPSLVLLKDREEHRGSTSALPPSNYGEKNSITDRYDLVGLFPSQSLPAIPEFIPQNVVGPLLEAEQSFLDGRYSAAGSCYRKALERSLKAIDPEIKGMLNARIRELERRNILPHTLIELLDQVRLFGNQAMHEDDIDPSKDDCSAARVFCELFFRYAFTLPAMIIAAKTKFQSDT